MESEFRTLVNGNNNFNGVTLEKFSALPEANVGIYFDTATIAGTNFMSEVMLLRRRFNQSQAVAPPQGNNETQFAVVSQALKFFLIPFLVLSSASVASRSTTQHDSIGLSNLEIQQVSSSSSLSRDSQTHVGSLCGQPSSPQSSSGFTLKHRMKKGSTC